LVEEFVIRRGQAADFATQVFHERVRGFDDRVFPERQHPAFDLCGVVELELGDEGAVRLWIELLGGVPAGFLDVADDRGEEPDADRLRAAVAAEDAERRSEVGFEIEVRRMLEPAVGEIGALQSINAVVPHLIVMRGVGDEVKGAAVVDEPVRVEGVGGRFG
jgi:hypothetical protein